MRFQTKGMEPATHDSTLAIAIQLCDQCVRWEVERMPVDPKAIKRLFPDCDLEKMNGGPLAPGQISVSVDAKSLMQRLKNDYDLVEVGQVGSFLERIQNAL